MADFRGDLFTMWETGAQQIEKSGIGKIVTAPVRIAESVIGAGEKAVTGAGEAVGAAPGIIKALPVILIILAGGVAAYLLFAGRKGTKLTPF